MSANDRLTEWLEGQEFYELMQAYRHTPVTLQAQVVEQFEAIKKRLLDVARGDGADPSPPGD
jgi:hypothetical protein